MRHVGSPRVGSSGSRGVPWCPVVVSRGVPWWCPVVSRGVPVVGLGVSACFVLVLHSPVMLSQLVSVA